MPSSRFRAWLFLLGFGLRRQFQARQMVVVTVALLGLLTAVVLLVTLRLGWQQTDDRFTRFPRSIAFVVGTAGVPDIDTSEQAIAQQKAQAGIAVFSRWIAFSLYLNFLMPLWSLSFATAAVGTDRENKSLIWLLTRPLPRWSIYLAKFLGVLPWCAVLNVGGFGLICLAGGHIGRQAFGLFWPAVLAGSLAFAALYALIGAVFARPAVVGMLYAFFFETILSELPVPGTLKRLSVNYYVRCLMYGSAEVQDIPTESGSLFVPLTESTAWIVLVTATLALTAFGMAAFSRSEYRDDG